MNKAAPMLAALQHGDSFFPSGAASFSWGVETLASEGVVSNAQDLEAFVLAQLKGRWASFDRGVVSAAYRNAGDIEEIRRIDSLVEAQTLAIEMRDGSHRSGLALLQMHEKLGNECAAAYRNLVRMSDANGNLTVMQGFLWATTGMSADDAELVSAHSLCVGLLGAAVRLGTIGHVEAQKILESMHTVVDGIIDLPPPPLERLQAFTPMSEIAVMRHETIDSRLFAN